MNKPVKILLWTLGIGGALYLAFKGTQKVLDAKAFADKLQLSIKPAAKKPIRFTGINNIEINLDVLISNPTKTSLTIEKPMVTIFYGDNILAQSKIPSGEDKNVTILPQTTSVVSMSFDVSLISNLGIWLEIGRTIGKDTSSATSKNELSTTLAANAQAVLQKLSFDIITYIGDTPITYKTSI